MFKHFVLHPCLFVFSAWLALATGAHAASLGEYAEEALLYNAEVLAARAQLEASVQQVRQAGVLPDPVLGVQYYLQPVETRTGPQEAAVSLTQPIPWFGKLSLRREGRQQVASMAQERLRATELRVIRLLKESYINYGFNAKAAQVALENLELLKYLESVAHTRYAGGKLSYANVLQIQIRLARTQETFASLTDKAVVLRSAINVLLGAPYDTSRTQPDEPLRIDFAMTDAELHAQALAKNPQLQIAQFNIRKEQAGLELAEKDYTPDMALSLKTILTGRAEYGDPEDSGRDPIIAGLTLTLPLHRDKLHGAVAEKQAAIRAARMDYKNQYRRLNEDIETRLFELRDARRRQMLYEESLVPKVKQELEVILQGFENGQASVFELIEVEKNMLEFEIAGCRAVADQAIVVARLEELVGVSLVAWQD